MKGFYWPILYSGLCLFYLLSLDFRPYPLDFLFKAMPVFLLMFACIQYSKGKPRLLLLATLAFSAAGDILLSLTFQNSFLFGLGAFLVAQIFYQIQLWPRRNWQKWKGLPLLVIGCFAGIMLYLLLPNLDKMQLPVIGYMLVISLMAASAVMAVTDSKRVMYGAMIFLISDALIAWNLFLQPIPYRSYLVMITYYLAQFLLICGILSMLQQDDNATT